MGYTINILVFIITLATLSITVLGPFKRFYSLDKVKYPLGVIYDVSKIDFNKNIKYDVDELESVQF